VPLGVPEVMPALNTGRINACYGSPVAMVALQWYTKVKYATSLPMSYGIGGSVLRKEVWEKISATDQKAIEKVLKVQAKKLRKIVRKDNGRALKAMKRAGVKIVETPADVVAAVDKAAGEVWKTKASKSDLEAVQKYLAEKR
jgi:TRAP-type C4-dicarboxylate transport system substrate-binding protein